MALYELHGLKDRIKEHERVTKALNENWKNQTVSQDGSIIHYGCEDGKFYAYAEWDKMAEVIADCRAIREEEAKDPNAYKWLGVQKWIMPSFIKLDLESRGVPVDEILQSGDHRELDKFFETDYKEFKLTNLSLNMIGSITK